MHVADLVIDQPQQQTEQLIRVYENTFDQEGAAVAAISQFESECLVLLDEGWRLKQVSHRGSIVSPRSVIATYEK